MKRVIDLKEVIGKTVKSINIKALKIVFSDNSYIEIGADGFEDDGTELWAVQGNK